MEWRRRSLDSYSRKWLDWSLIASWHFAFNSPFISACVSSVSLCSESEVLYPTLRACTCTFLQTCRLLFDGSQYRCLAPGLSILWYCVSIPTLLTPFRSLLVIRLQVSFSFILFHVRWLRDNHMWKTTHHKKHMCVSYGYRHDFWVRRACEQTAGNIEATLSGFWGVFRCVVWKVSVYHVESMEWPFREITRLMQS